MIMSILDCYQDTATRDKFIFPSAITCILTHIHVTIPPSPFFHVMGAMSKESIRRIAEWMTTKQPHVETMDVTPTPWPSSTYAFSFSSKADISLTDIMDQLQHMRADFGNRLNHLCDGMCQMNTIIDHIGCLQSHLGGFVP